MVKNLIFDSTGKSIICAAILWEVYNDEAEPVHISDIEKKTIEDPIFTFPRDEPPYDVYKKYGGKEIDMYEAMLIYEKKFQRMVKFEEDELTGFINELELSTRVYAEDRYYFPLKVVQEAIKTGLPSVYMNPRGIFKDFHSRCRRVRTERQRATKTIEFLSKGDTLFAEVELENYIEDLVAESVAKRYKKERVILISSRGALVYEHHNVKKISSSEARKIFDSIPGEIKKITPE